MSYITVNLDNLQPTCASCRNVKFFHPSARCNAYVEATALQMAEYAEEQAAYARSVAHVYMAQASEWRRRI